MKDVAMFILIKLGYMSHFKSNWCKGQSKFATRDSKTLTMFSFATGENVS